MTDTAIAPEWIDSDVCLRCRDAFTTFNRRHHCRNCGLIFDHKCSSKTLPLPHFGITQAVRVCEACHFKLTKKKEAEQAAKEANEAKKKAAARAAAVDAIDPDLQKAIQLSLQESQARPGYTPSSSANRWQVSEPPIIDRATRPEDDEDEQLRAAIEASLREAQAPRPQHLSLTKSLRPSLLYPLWPLMNSTHTRATRSSRSTRLSCPALYRTHEGSMSSLIEQRRIDRN
jgi:growth factor-regulated tyrosine kinase substrate